MSWRATVEGYPSILDGLPHPNGVRTLSHVRVVGPGLPVESPVSRALTDRHLVEFAEGPEHLLELFFDGGVGQSWDLRPTLPLVIWHR